MKAVEWVKRQLYQIHPYYFTPNLDPAEEERRIREFLDGADADQPMIVESRDKANDEQDPMA